MAIDLNKTSKIFLVVVLLAALAYLLYQSFHGNIPADHFKSPGDNVAPVPDNSGTDQEIGDAGGCSNRGAIRTPVAVLWHEPGQLRGYDGSILGKDNDPAAWAAGMDTNMRLWLVGRAETTVLFGEPVIILERRGDWLKVAAEWQRTSLNALGYPGWVPAEHVASSDVYNDHLETLPAVVITDKTAGIFSDPALTEPLMEAGYMTALPLLEEREQSVIVRLPAGGSAYLPRGSVKKAGDLYFSGSGIVEEAKKFIGLRYIWGGASPYGFDCSGFTMRLYQSQGISIPRDADEQAMAGAAVSRAELMPGDLIFFAAKGGLGQIHHVGMYIGDGMIIHSPNSGSAVAVQALDSVFNGEEYWGARRYAD